MTHFNLNLSLPDYQTHPFLPPLIICLSVAALPVMVETISKKIVKHITDECLICYDVGVPCGARQACDDPSSLIFPFQVKPSIHICFYLTSKMTKTPIKS